MNNLLYSAGLQTPSILLPFSAIKAFKNRFVLTLCLVFSVFVVQAQWNKLNTPTMAGSHVLSIHFVNDNIGYVVGTNGLVSKTTDAGVTWTNQTSINIPTGAYIASTYFIDALTGFAVGDNDLILRTADGGATWIKVIPIPSITGQAYRAVWFYNAYEGYITGGVSGSKGTILKTSDGGLTWSDKLPNNGNVIYGIFKTDALNAFAVDFDGRIIKSTDGGNTWISPVTPQIPGTQLGSIYFLSPSIGYIVGGKAATNQGYIYKTIDGGTNWNPISITPPPPFLADIKFFGNVGYAVGGNTPANNTGVIYKNSPAGSPTWSPETLTPNSGRQSEVSISSTYIAYSCGLNGTVYKLSPKPCCDDFMTDAINYGIQTTLVQGTSSTYKFCLSPNIRTSDDVKWDLDCNGSVDAPSTVTVNPQCATFNLTSANTTICATITRVNGTDTCRVKVNACLPKLATCLCDSTFINAVTQCFTTTKITTTPFTYTFTPAALQNNCDSVSWTFQDGSPTSLSAGNQSVTHTFPSAGSRLICMFVTRKDANGNICKRECCIQLAVTTAVAEIPAEVSLIVKPNPTSNAVSVSVPAMLVKKENSLHLSTIEGRVLMSVPADAAETNLNLDVLPTGLYFLSLTDSKGNILTKPAKLVKQ